MKKVLSLFLMVSFLAFGTGVYAENILPANIPVTVQVNNNYSSDSLNVGDNVIFSVLSDITANSNIAIPAGTSVYAAVKNVKSSSRIGKSGMISLGDFYTTSKNGVKIPLTGVIEERAKSKTGLSVALSLLMPFFLLMHGENAHLNQGAQYTLFTSSNTSL